MKIATWNVNGIRAREAQFCDWVERDRPDVVCLQELKAQPDQIPVRCAHADYHVYWHGMRAYSGVSLHVSKALHGDPPQFTHPAFDMPLLRPAILVTLVFSFTRAMTAVSAVIFLATAKYNLSTVYIINRVEAGEYPLAIVYSTVLMAFMLCRFAQPWPRQP